MEIRNINEQCNKCKHDNRSSTQMPCSRCSWITPISEIYDRFEAKDEK